MLTALAWRNVWRQPHRTALSLASIALASAITVFLLSLQRGAYGTMQENVLRLSDGFAQLQPPGYQDDPSLHRTIDDPDAVAARVQQIPGVTAAAPRATTYAILSNRIRSYAAAVAGVDPARERGVSTLGTTVVRGRPLAPGDSDAAVLGAALARNLMLSVGDTVTVLGSARDGTVAADVLTVVGLFQTGTPVLDRQLLEMPLPRFQRDFAMGGRATVVAVTGRRLADVDAALPALRAVARRDGLVLRDWTQLEPALHDIILLDASFSSLVYVALVVIVVFIILNTLLMSVLERTREFGMLMAVGMRPTQIGRMLWIELLLLAGTGALIGIALGAGVAAWTGTHGIPFPNAEALFSQWHMPATLYPQVDLVSVLSGPLAIVAAIAVAGVVPYRRVRRLQPVAAMRAA